MKEQKYASFDMQSVHRKIIIRKLPPLTKAIRNLSKFLLSISGVICFAG